MQVDASDDADLINDADADKDMETDIDTDIDLDIDADIDKWIGTSTSKLAPDTSFAHNTGYFSVFNMCGNVPLD